MTTYNYSQIKASGRKQGVCAVCGRKATRSATFTNTINPFNRNPDGSIRTPAEVRACVQRDLAEWQSKPVTHEACENA